jgi:hypothetical protein
MEKRAGKTPPFSPFCGAISGRRQNKKYQDNKLEKQGCWAVEHRPTALFF